MGEGLRGDDLVGPGIGLLMQFDKEGELDGDAAVQSLYHLFGEAVVQGTEEQEVGVGGGGGQFGYGCIRFFFRLAEAQSRDCGQDQQGDEKKDGLVEHFSRISLKLALFRPGQGECLMPSSCRVPHPAGVKHRDNLPDIAGPVHCLFLIARAAVLSGMGEIRLDRNVVKIYYVHIHIKSSLCNRAGRKTKTMTRRRECV